ncbi:hypothetical protein COCMIDRAFT_26365 [Bipolaris oryzae ATCC 44560]|uniref:Uncharacterized protein n=1 Tax=Bipolaris oryzae ATCC 44560 TaxID=930090 RepID=W6ZP91_COCMI|nr:uncharacterized protein COCMIDRAFT_26365 [Bipolaris oryzae ATCC 44560]EUC45431.1 hypothetical protein COCMIDRAFT_26365 [Bipolaris oryzae ATCC 44560]
MARLGGIACCWLLAAGRLPACWDRPRTTRKRPVGGQGTTLTLPARPTAATGFFPYHHCHVHMYVRACTRAKQDTHPCPRLRTRLGLPVGMHIPYSTVALLYPAHIRIPSDIPPTERPSACLAWWLGSSCTAPRELGRGLVLVLVLVLVQWQCHDRCFRPPGLVAPARPFFSPHPPPSDPNTPAFRMR